MPQALYRIEKNKETGRIELSCQYWNDPYYSDYFYEMNDDEIAQFTLHLYGQGYGDGEYSFEDAMTIYLKIKAGDYSVYPSEEELERQWLKSKKEKQR